MEPQNTERLTRREYASLTSIKNKENSNQTPAFYIEKQISETVSNKESSRKLTNKASFSMQQKSQAA